MIQKLTSDQVKSMSLGEKDRWWFEHIYRGNMPQLTLRSGLTGALLGGILCLTNLYIGIKTGWGLGVGITSVILSFAMFKVFSKVGIGSEMTILENNTMQSCATAAGYMTGPLVASIPALMMYTGNVVPMWQVIMWVIGLAVLGVLFAFPLKKRFINDEQHDFPEGKACGEVLDGLHSGDGEEGIFKSKIILVAGFAAAFITLLKSEKIMTNIGTKFLTIPESIDGFLWKLVEQPTIWGSKINNLTIALETDLAMFAAGGLMGIKTGVSLLIGAAINFAILVPYFISEGVIENAGFKKIVVWTLWGGVSMMLTSSLFAFFSKPGQIISAFKGMFGHKSVSDEDILKDIELPMKVFVIGIPIVGACVVVMANIFFDVQIWLGVVAIPMVFIYSLVAVNSTALTSITPGGALGKVTQLQYAVLAPGDISTNLMTAGITAETSGNASNLLMDIKPGYMLGAKPRHQAIAHVIGAVVGTLVAVPVFYMMFDGKLKVFGSAEMPLPSAVVWKAVADILSKGVSSLHYTTQVAFVVGGLLGIFMEVVNVLFARRAKKIVAEAKACGTHESMMPRPVSSLPFSAVGIGLAAIIPFSTSFIMATGAIFFSLMAKRANGKTEQSLMNRVFANQETLCAGLVAGAAIMGIVTMLIGMKLG